MALPSRAITVVLLRLKPDDDYFTHSPRLPKTVLTLEVNESDTVGHVLDLLVQTLVKKNKQYSLDTETTLAFFFKHTQGKDVICREENGGVLHHRVESMQATVFSVDCDKIVFVEKKLQEMVHSKMASHFKIHKVVWQSNERCSMSLQDKTYLQGIFENNCELMVSPSPANRILLRNFPALFRA
jgi:hypothetical protein